MQLLEKTLGNGTTSIGKKIKGQLLKLPGTNQKIKSERNFLTLEVNRQDNILAKWFTENLDKPIEYKLEPIVGKSL